MSNYFPDVLQQFDIQGSLIAFEEIKGGNIHRSFVSTWEQNNCETRFLHQEMNTHVFKDPNALMQNTQILLDHINNSSIRFKRSYQVIRTRSAAPYLFTEQDRFWRTFSYIDGTYSVEHCSSSKQVAQIASAFAKFQMILITLDSSCLKPVLPGFRDLPKRFQDLEQERQRSVENQAEDAKALFDKILSQRSLVQSFYASTNHPQVPKRITHGDLKVSNVLFDTSTEEVVSVVDLDTCLPGSLAFDFGDFVRSACVSCSEDEINVDQIAVRQDYIECLFEAFIRPLSHLLTQRETEALAVAPAVVAVTLAARFLRDFLIGDVYFKVRYPKHNLNRAITQYAIFEKLLNQRDFISRLCRNLKK
ncbi:MAG: aminoglycoside phosphotransferase family protein [Bdellovibrionales bacterium]|nr:aminoglycoside phosphotransferase family protein [Bdellovibrionales bacterium]